MLTISVRADIKGALAKLALAREQVPFATAMALTKTAQATRDHLKAELSTAFDRPTPFTQNALYVRPATKAKLEAHVYVKDHAAKGNPATRWFRPNVYGGARSLKGFESLLQRNGKMPTGWYAIPARGAPLDQFGGISGALLNKVLSQLGARRDPGQNEPARLKRKRNQKQAFGRYFAVWPGQSHLAPGIYERASFAHGSAVRPVFVYTRAQPQYRQRYRFYDVGIAFARQRFPIEFKRAAEIAMKTAKR